MSEPCPCHACVVAGVDRPSVTIPAFRGDPALELHGRELARYYEAQDELRATLAKFAHTPAAKAIAKVLKFPDDAA